MEISSRPFYGVYGSQFMRFARMCSYVSDFNSRNHFDCYVIKTRLKI